MTNLGKYNEGQLVYERVAFPTDTETVQAALKKIGIDGIRYEEVFIADYDGDMPQLYEHLGEYESIDELNHLACLLSELNEYELEVFEAVMDSGEYTGSVKDLINLAQNLDSYNFYSDIHTEEELGRMYIQELEAVPVPEHLIDYIDYEAYGRDEDRVSGALSADRFAKLSGGYEKEQEELKQSAKELQTIVNTIEISGRPASHSTASAFT